MNATDQINVCRVCGEHSGEMTDLCDRHAHRGAWADPEFRAAADRGEDLEGNPSYSGQGESHGVYLPGYRGAIATGDYAWCVTAGIAWARSEYPEAGEPSVDVIDPE